MVIPVIRLCSDVQFASELPRLRSIRSGFPHAFLCYSAGACNVESERRKRKRAARALLEKRASLRIPPAPSGWRPRISADPTFKPRERECGRQCGRRFWTTSRWRYYCKSCRDLPSIRAGGAPYAGSLKVPDETSA